MCMKRVRFVGVKFIQKEWETKKIRGILARNCLFARAGGIEMVLLGERVFAVAEFLTDVV